jgi:beta-phosphoglucomutase-like phosphatase (HAD superfamily)
VLEDSPNGARAAQAAGMTCYAVADPRHIRPEAFAGINDHVFNSLHDVLAELRM